MLRIDQIRLLPGDSEALLPGKCARILRLPAEDIGSCAVLRRAIDAREGLTLVYTAAVEVKREDTVLRRCRDRRVSRYAPETYALPAAVTAPEIPPIVVGAGPAGLFAALVLARCGARPHCAGARAARWSSGRRDVAALLAQRRDWTPRATSSSARAAQARFPTAS